MNLGTAITAASLAYALKNTYENTKQINRDLPLLYEGTKQYMRGQFEKGSAISGKRSQTMGRKIKRMSFGPETKGQNTQSAQKQLVAKGINGPVRSPTSTYAFASRPKGRKQNNMPMGSENGVTAFFRAETEISNSNTGGLDLGATTLLGTTNNSYYIGGTYLPQLGTMSGLYREFRIKKIRISYVPRNAYTTVGSIAIGVDDDPRGSIPATGTAGFGKTNIAKVSKLANYLLTDIKEPAQFVYIPRSAEGQRWRYTSDTSGRPLEFTSHGALMIASNNNIADTTTSLGLVYFEIWVEFRSPN